MRSAAEAGSRSASRLLIGRDEVLSRLEQLYDEAAVGDRLTTALVEGPAGIGKTRVVLELADRVQAKGGSVLIGHCVAQGGQTLPYAPIVELLGELVRRDGAAAVRRWAGPAGDELGRLVPALATAEQLGAPGSAAGHSLLFQGLSSLLHNLSRRGPLLVLIEDVHWADTSTRELLAVFARQQQGPIVLLVTLRSDESPVPAGLSRYVAELVRRGDHRIRLQPLSREEQAHQISDILGVPPRRRLLDDVYTRAEGNPFFAEELLVLADQERDSLPATVRDLLLARLESLDPATRQVLRTASVAGRVVPYQLLEAVVDISGERLEGVLRPAVDAHVLEPAGDALSFRHALLQEAIAASLLPGEAARTHRRMAVALTDRPELVGSEYRGVAGRIARHWDAAGDREHALVASVAAGREASTSLAFAESLFHYERALELLGTVPDAERLIDVPRARLLRSVAEVAHLSAHPDRATALVTEAIACADPDDAHLRGWLHERLGRYLWMAGDGQGALAAYEEAVDLVPADPPTRSRAAVLSGLSQILMLADRYTESEERARQAIVVAGQVEGGRSIEGHARCNLGVALAYTGRLDEGIAELRSAIRIADEEMDDVDENARALVNLGSALIVGGRVEEAAETALLSVRVGDELGLSRRKGTWCRCDAAEYLLLLGRFDEAGRLMDEARELDPQGVDAFRTDLVEGVVRLRQGSIDDARALLERARAASGRLLDPQLLGPLYAGLVETMGWLDDSEATAELVQEGLLRLDGSPVHPNFEVPFLTASVWASVALADPIVVNAEAMIDRAQVSLDAFPGEIPYAAAELATARAELSETPEAWDAALEPWLRLGELYRETYVRLRSAESLLAAGGNRSAAGVQLEHALSTGRRIGAALLVEKAADLARRSRLAVPAVGPGGNPHRLTSREREVLGLVADGLTDREIGSRLFISHRTVERHVSNLLAKLDAGRRSELVATAHREGLVGTG